MDTIPSLKDILGVDQQEISLETLLLKGSTPSRIPASKTNKSEIFVPKFPQQWVLSMIEASEEDRDTYFQQIPGGPNHLEIINLLNSRSILIRLTQVFQQDIWVGLDRHIPRWLTNNEVVDVVRHNDSCLALDYIVKNHPHILRNTMGIQPIENNPDQWEICPYTVDGGLNDRSFRETRTSMLARRLGEIWPKYEEEAIGLENDHKKAGRAPWILPKYLSGAERFVVFMEDDVRKKVSQWLWKHVKELNDFRTGENGAWQKSTHSDEHNIHFKTDHWLGRVLIQHTLRILEGNGESPGYGTDKIDQLTLDHLIFKDNEIFQRLIPDDAVSVFSMSVLNNPGQLNRILTDQKTAVSMLHLLQRSCQSDWTGWNGQRPAPRKDLGWTSEKLLEASEVKRKKKDKGGLIEACVISANNAVLDSLLDTVEGTNLVLETLKGPDAGPKIYFMGTRMGWRDFGKKVKATPAWNAWRDDCGNTIIHWLSYGYNKIDQKVNIKIHEQLAIKFPELITVQNSKGYFPTDFMPKEHANHIAGRMIGRAAKRTDEEKNAAPAKRKRTL